jgi:hypothetical protein
MSGAVLGDALKSQQKGRKSKAPAEGGDEKKRQRRPVVHKASYATAQKRIKKGLGIANTVEGDAYVSMGRCLDDCAAAIVDRWVEFAPVNGVEGKSNKTLSGVLALSGTMSLVPDEQHDAVENFINDSLNAFYASEK